MAVERQMNIRAPARVLQNFAVSGCRQLWSGCLCVWCSAVERSGVCVRQMAQPCWKASDELFAFEVRFQTLNRFLFTY